MGDLIIQLAVYTAAGVQEPLEAQSMDRPNIHHGSPYKMG